MRLSLSMQIGKFGIFLVKLGRKLQEKYANWNSEFRLKQEFYPNPDICDLHVSFLVTESIIQTFDSRFSNLKNQTPMVKDILLVEGVSKLQLTPYKISITKAPVFSWHEILPDVEKIILKYGTKE